jgi:hypothetical protein
VPAPPPPPPTYSDGSNAATGGPGYGSTGSSAHRRLIQLPDQQLQDASGSVAIVYSLPVACADLSTDKLAQEVQALVEDELLELESVDAWASSCQDVPLQSRAPARRLQGAPLSRTTVQVAFSGATSEELGRYADAVARAATSEHAKQLVVRSAAAGRAAGYEALLSKGVQARALPGSARQLFA